MTAVLILIVLVLCLVVVVLFRRLAASGGSDVTLMAQVAELREQLAIRPYTEHDLQRARKHSVQTSRNVVSGSVQEHVAPLLPEFACRYNLRDARFLGAPVDYIVFEGLEEGEVTQVTFVEIKTGRAVLNPRERKIKSAIDQGRVGFETIRLDQVKGHAELEVGDTTAAAVASPPPIRRAMGR